MSHAGWPLSVRAVAAGPKAWPRARVYVAWLKGRIRVAPSHQIIGRYKDRPIDPGHCTPSGDHVRKIGGGAPPAPPSALLTRRRRAAAVVAAQEKYLSIFEGATHQRRGQGIGTGHELRTKRGRRGQNDAPCGVAGHLGNAMKKARGGPTPGNQSSDHLRTCSGWLRAYVALGLKGVAVLFAERRVRANVLGSPRCSSCLTHVGPQRGLDRVLPLNGKGKAAVGMLLLPRPAPYGVEPPLSHRLGRRNARRLLRALVAGGPPA